MMIYFLTENRRYFEILKKSRYFVFDVLTLFVSPDFLKKKPSNSKGI